MHLSRLCKCLFRLLAAFSENNFSNVYIIGFLKVYGFTLAIDLEQFEQQVKT